MIGTTLGRFRVVALLGAGGMGEVYEAEDATLARRVALKVLPSGVAADPARRARFLREARAAAKLGHPGIVAVHEAVEIDGKLVLVMELVRGTTLDSLVPAGGMSLREVLGHAIPLTSAVAGAHVEGIVHRDLKPNNVMVTGDGRLKVLDFGIARHAASGEGDAGSTATETAEGTVLGTVATGAAPTTCCRSPTRMATPRPSSSSTAASGPPASRARAIRGTSRSTTRRAGGPCAAGRTRARRCPKGRC